MAMCLGLTSISILGSHGKSRVKGLGLALEGGGFWRASKKGAWGTQ